MSRLQTFHTISDYLPFRRTRAPKLDTESASIYDELDHHNYDAVHFELSAALARAENQADLPEELSAAITGDAHDLACRMLPAEMADLFELTPRYPDNTAFEADTPSLRSLYLLVHAYDRTHDTALRHAIEYMFARTPPQLSELLGEAYTNSLATDSTVLAEYRKLAADNDDRLDGVMAAGQETETPDATLASGERLGRAALRLRNINE